MVWLILFNCKLPTPHNRGDFCYMPIENLKALRPPNLRTFENRITIGEARNIKTLFGQIGFRSFVDLLRGKKVEDFESREIDAIFYSNLSKVYKVEPNSARSFFMKQLSEANRIIDHLRSLFDLPESTEGFYNETSLVSTFAFDRLKYLTKEYVPRINFEVNRQLLLAQVSGVIDRHHAKDEVKDTLSKLHDFISKTLYQGPQIGTTKHLSLFSLHDNKTNSLIDFNQDFSVLNPTHNQHVKESGFSVRTTKLGIPVLTHVRKKDDIKISLKTISKALRSGLSNCFDPATDVEDKMGFMFIVFGGEKQRLSVKNSFDRRVRQFAKNRSQEVHIKMDKDKTKDRGQSAKGHNYVKEKILLDNKTPIEVIFFTPKEYLEYIFEVGTENEDGIYNGNAHELYELRRDAELLIHLFPSAIYTDLDIDYYIRKKMKEVSQKLIKQSQFN